MAKLKTHEGKVHSVLYRGLSVVKGHNLFPLIPYPPTTMVNRFISICFTMAAITFSGAVCVCTTAVGM